MDLDLRNLLFFSLKYFDRTQGESPEVWEDNKILSKAINRIQRICNTTVQGRYSIQNTKNLGNYILNASQLIII